MRAERFHGKKRGVSTTVAVAAIVIIAIIAGVAGYFGGASQATTTTITEHHTITSTITQTAAVQTVTQTVTQTVAGEGVLGKKLKVAIIVPGRANDYGWNQEGVEGLRKVAAKFGAEFSFSEGLGYGEPPLRALEDYIRKGYDLVVGHAGGYREFCLELVRTGRIGQSKVLIVSEAQEGMEERDVVPGKLGTYSFVVTAASYPAGYLAGLMTKSNIVGIVQSVETDINWIRQSAAFAQGLKAANPRAKLLFTVVGSYEDPAKGKEYTAAQIGLGADVIFGQGDGTSFGIMDACRDAGVWFIDVIGDKRAIDEKGILLTSVLWDFSKAYEQAVIDIYNGEFGKHNYYMSHANQAIYLLTLNPKVPADIAAKVNEISKKVQAGEIKVKVPNSIEDLHAIFRELGYE
ncbi:MAG: BMP family ABC transporter substrate-binding protein [Thaumarchaeota archaeon]|nr:BMP family ABC transporter substrate-binding protein [Nitrososphaerota archaeon]